MLFDPGQCGLECGHLRIQLGIVFGVSAAIYQATRRRVFMLAVKIDAAHDRIKAPILDVALVLL